MCDLLVIDLITATSGRVGPQILLCTVGLTWPSKPKKPDTRCRFNTHTNTHTHERRALQSENFKIPPVDLESPSYICIHHGFDQY